MSHKSTGDRGYAVIGRSEQPRDLVALIYEGMAKEMIDILEVECINMVSPVCHDHGSIRHNDYITPFLGA